MVARAKYPFEISRLLIIGFPTPSAKTRFRQILGSFAWLIQTQDHLPFTATRLATEATHRADCPRGVRGMDYLANEIIRTLVHRPLAVWYSELPPHALPNVSIQSLRLFTFSDCGFGTLRGSRSVESMMAVLAKPIRRDGDILPAGHLISCGTNKISRTSRSTLATETCELANAAALGVRNQCLLIDVYLPFAPKLHIGMSGPLPSNHPFLPPPMIGNVKLASIGESIFFVSHPPSLGSM